MVGATLVWLVPDPTFIVVVSLIAVLALLPIWAFLSAVAAPDILWQRVAVSKSVWVIWLAASFVLFYPLSIVLGVIYLLRVRPQIRVQ